MLAAGYLLAVVAVGTWAGSQGPTTLAIGHGTRLRSSTKLVVWGERCGVGLLGFREGARLRAKVRASAEDTEGAHAKSGSRATVVALAVIGELRRTKAGVGAARRQLRGRRAGRRQNGEQPDQHHPLVSCCSGSRLEWNDNPKRKQPAAVYATRQPCRKVYRRGLAYSHSFREVAGYFPCHGLQQPARYHFVPQTYDVLSAAARHSSSRSNTSTYRSRCQAATLTCSFGRRTALCRPPSEAARR